MRHIFCVQQKLTPHRIFCHFRIVASDQLQCTLNQCQRIFLTNTRASGSDDALKLTPPRILSLEEALDFIENDELVEVTPKSIRMRKKILDTKMRMRANRK